jgi:hypothetical protein
MAVLNHVESAVARLLERYPGSVYGWDASDVHLAPWAVFAAEELQRRFGDAVELDVGALPYPPGREPRDGFGPPKTSDFPELPLPDGVAVELDGPVEVRSGHTAQIACLLHNRTDSDLWVTLGGAVVVDPNTGEVVGGSAEPRTFALSGPIVPAGQTFTITWGFGTASFTRRLGYAVPAGIWGLQVILGLPPDPRRRPRRRTPVFPLTIKG